MKKITLVLCVLLFSNFLYAQKPSCKVIHKDLIGVYKGECQSGLANGIGTFTFENGMFVYKGEFVNGKMHGKGEIYSLMNKKKKLISKGFWEDNVFQESKGLKPYDVTREVNLDRNIVRKINDGNRLIINFFQNGNRNNARNVNVNLSSGNLSPGSNVLIYDNIIFPVTCDITYTTSSKFKATSYNVQFELIINESGEWEISLYN